MERLCDLRAQRLLVGCPPCGRRGVYDLTRLRQRFGDHADLYLRLTQTCCYQGSVGTKQPNQYGRTRRAAIGVEDGDGRTGLPSRT